MTTVVLATVRGPWQIPVVATAVALITVTYLRIRACRVEEAKRRDVAESFHDTLKRIQTTWNWQCISKACSDIFSLQWSVPELRAHVSHFARLDLFERMMPEPALDFIADHVNIKTWAQHYAIPSALGITQFCSGYTARRWSTVNRFVLLEDPKSAWSARLDLIEGATRTINIVIAYVYLDRYGYEFCEALAAASRRGVTVQLIIDAFGAESFAFGGENPHHPPRMDGQPLIFEDLLLMMADAGIQVGYWYGHSSKAGKEFPTKNHTKMIIVDSTYVVIGDRNIGAEYFMDWPGVDCLLEGDVGKEFEDIIETDMVGRVVWKSRLPSAHTRSRPTSPNRADEERVKILDRKLSQLDVLHHGETLDASAVTQIPQTSGYDPILHIVLEKIQSAEVAIDIRSSYVVFANVVQDALVAAAGRGVRVRIVTNSSETCDLPFILSAQMMSLVKPVEAGAHVYMTKGNVSHMDHSKIVVIDNKWISIGSWNFWTRSHFYEAEVNVVLESKETAGSIVRTAIDSWVSQDRIASGKIVLATVADLLYEADLITKRGFPLDNLSKAFLS